MTSLQLHSVLAGVARLNTAGAVRIMAGALALVAMAGPANARKHEAPPPMPAGYDDPGPPPQDPLPGIVDKLRRELIDPGSLRDVTMCAPRSIPVFSVGSEWSAAEWIVQLSLNSKNRFGGYTGTVEYTAYIRNGVVVEVSATSPIEMYLPVVRESYVRSAADCPRVPNAEIQKLVDQ